MTACSCAVSAHVCWNWAVRAARTAIPLFILGHTLSTCRSLDMRRLGSIRKPCRAFVQRFAGVTLRQYIGRRDGWPIQARFWLEWGFCDGSHALKIAKLII